MSERVDIYRDEANQKWRWRRTSNGRHVVDSGEGFASITACINSVVSRNTAPYVMHLPSSLEEVFRDWTEEDGSTEGGWDGGPYLGPQQDGSTIL